MPLTPRLHPELLKRRLTNLLRLSLWKIDLRAENRGLEENLQQEQVVPNYRVVQENQRWSAKRQRVAMRRLEQMYIMESEKLRMLENKRSWRSLIRHLKI